MTAAVGLIFGLPAARLKGLYLAIATLAAQYILLDFFARAEWFTGGSVPASAEPFSIFGYSLRGDRKYFYVVLAYVVVCYLLVTNLIRSRDGRALVAARPYLRGNPGINLTKYRRHVRSPLLCRGRRRALCTLQSGGSNEGWHRTPITFLAALVTAIWLRSGNADGHSSQCVGAHGALEPRAAWQAQLPLSRIGASSRPREMRRGSTSPFWSSELTTRAPLAADQGLLETLPVLALRSERDGQ